MRSPRRTALFVAIPAVLLCVLLAATSARAQGRQSLEARARALLRQVPLIDGHNDLPWAIRDASGYDFSKTDIRQPQPRLHTDIDRLRRGGLGAQFWSVFVPAELTGDKAVSATLEQIDAVYMMLRRYPETFELALTAADVERVFEAGKIASLIGMEGGHSINSSLGALRMFHRLGVRYMTLTHGTNVPWADSGTDQARAGGLTPFGEAVVREMNWRGMLVDLSHVSPDTMKDALRVTAAPVIFSHSSTRALCDVPRNVPDDVLRLLPANGGVVMVTFVPDFVSPAAARYGEKTREHRRSLETRLGADEAAIRVEMEKYRAAHPAPRVTVAQVADHIDHVRRIAGIDHVGIGSDFDGITSTPVGLEDVSKYPALVVELLRRGYSDDDVKKVLGLNLLRVMRAAEATAARLQAERGPSVVTIEQLDARR
jgi:membrane dipeptidase